MKISGNIEDIKLIEVNEENRINIFELLTDNNSSGRIHLFFEEEPPRVGENIMSISDSDGNILNYTIN